MDRLKLAQGLRNLPASAREDLAGREQDIQRGKTVELLRRAGKEMYENPIVNTAVGLSPVLGDIQAGVEAYRSAQEGDWGNAGLNAVGMLPFIPMLGKTVWHGSPHTFDKFDLSKIGTGEGAQSYGHGLYLAEARPTAEEYAKNLSEDLMIPAKRLLTKSGNDVDAAINAANEEINRLRSLDLTPQSGSARRDSMVESQLSNLRELQKYKDTGEFTAGNLYKVDLPDEQIAKMLDWDKPLSQQAPEVQQGIMASGLVGPKHDIANDELLAGEFVRGLSPEHQQWLYTKGGIPGIQYLDQASRDPSQRFIARSPQGGESVFNSAQEAQDYIAQMAKHGHEFEYVDPNLTRNYVVFSDEIPQILERNNQPVGMFK